MFPIESCELNFIHLFNSRYGITVQEAYHFPFAKLLLSPLPFRLQSTEIPWKVSKKRISFPKWNRSNSNPPSIRADINFNLSPSPLHDSRIHGEFSGFFCRVSAAEVEERSANRKWASISGRESWRGGRRLLCPKEDRRKLVETYFRDRHLMESWNVFPSNDSRFLIFRYLISKLDIRIRSNFFSSKSLLLLYYSHDGCWKKKEKVQDASIKRWINFATRLPSNVIILSFTIKCNNPSNRSNTSNSILKMELD